MDRNKKFILLSKYSGNKDIIKKINPKVNPKLLQKNFQLKNCF